MNIIVFCKGFIGDILFASSLAKKLKEKYTGCHITYVIPLPQPKLLLEQNPYIDQVSVLGSDDHGRSRSGAEWIYDMVIDIPEVDQRYPATIQMQAAAGIENQSLEFDVWTVPEFDADATAFFESINRRKVIMNQTDWAWRAYQCTSETLSQGIGAPHRNTENIIDNLREKLNDVGLISVGYNRLVSSLDPPTHDPIAFAKAASRIKMADYFIGAEGGLSNLAAAVGTKCIITTDFIAQNYGPNGRVKKIENPQMGPAIYYPDAGHVHLDPCITDAGIIDSIKEIVG